MSKISLKANSANLAKRKYKVWTETPFQQNEKRAKNKASVWHYKHNRLWIDCFCLKPFPWWRGASSRNKSLPKRMLHSSLLCPRQLHSHNDMKTTNYSFVLDYDVPRWRRQRYFYKQLLCLYNSYTAFLCSWKINAYDWKQKRSKPFVAAIMSADFDLKKSLTACRKRWYRKEK